MKFAKYLEENCIPEWKAAYFDYKKGKKLIKRVQVQKTSRDGSRSKSAKQDSPSSTPLVDGTQPRAGPTYGATANSQVERNAVDGFPEVFLRSGDRADTDLSFPAATVSDNNQSGSPGRRMGLTKRLSRWNSGPGDAGDRTIHEEIELLPSDEAQQTFYVFLEQEIQKIDRFYTEREADAGKRLIELRFQLQEMKDRKRMIANKRKPTVAERRAARSDYSSAAIRIAANVRSLFSYADSDLINNHPLDDDPKSETATQMLLTYRVARRRLRIAIQEFYNSLELLQSYRTLNRTALTKVLKKFDKTAGVKAGPVFLRILNSKTYIGNSDFLEKIMHESEDVYAKYYYHGDRKHAVSALRTKQHTEDYRFTMLRIGTYFGLAIVMGLEGLVRSQVDKSSDTLRVYLLQVWAAFFLLILITLLFGVNCYLWTRNKINYVFIFEFDVRHNLNWMQYLELPAFITFLFSLFFWMCFSDFFPSFKIWYPLLFAGTTAVVLLAPVPIFHFSSRKWFANAHGRLLVSGLSSVRFQDVFLGDQYNSLTYSVGNIALFLCLYRFGWIDPVRCGSGRSVLLGAFTTFPGITRLFQCFRRFYDTRHYFPHLVNAGKYSCTILQYTCLSLWRIHGYERFKILYILFACANSIYTATWDVLMDASLLQPGAKPILLRNQRAFSYTWAYYVFLVLDPVLRCSWIFYVIYSHDKQHAAALSFYIGLAEVFRRAMWSAFRVENEHVANVSTYRATRELPLPYAHHTDEDIESQQRRSGDRSKTRNEPPSITSAHATDFERRKNDSLHGDDVVVDSDGSDDEPPSLPNTPDDTDQEDV